MKIKKKIAVLGMVAVLGLSATGCREANRVSHNVSKEADNFNVVRRLSVMSAITNEPVFELIGAFSFETTSDRLDAVVRTDKNDYKKHSIGFGENVVWVVEDLEGLDVSNFKYEVNFAPEMIQPIKITTNK